jgi:hypothetical protein
MGNMKGRIALRLIAVFAACFIGLSAFPAFPVLAEGEDSGDVENEEVSTDIAVTDIEIGDYKDRINIGETTELNANVLPVDATNQTVTYTSSDTTILSVNSKGQVKGLAVGVAAIRLQADDAAREIAITVKGAATTGIRLNRDYIVLKPGDSFRVAATVMPQAAAQGMEFKSLSPDVATVDGDGVIRAKKLGTASILVSNEDMLVSLSVVVNYTSAASPREQTNGVGKPGSSDSEAMVALSGDDILANIEYGAGSVSVSRSNCPVLSKAILKALQQSGASLRVESDSYSLSISGSDVVNFQNELSTYILFEKEEGGMSFVLGEGGALPGMVSLALSGETADYRYLYLYSDTKGKYEELDAASGDELRIDEAGKYLLTSEKLDSMQIRTPWIIGAAAIIAVSIAVFVMVRRRYWFW